MLYSVSVINFFGDIGNVFVLCVFGLTLAFFAVRALRTWQKKHVAQPVTFYQRRVKKLTHQHHLNAGELRILQDYARMERDRRKRYYNYLDRNSRYF